MILPVLPLTRKPGVEPKERIIKETTSLRFPFQSYKMRQSFLLLPNEILYDLNSPFTLFTSTGLHFIFLDQNPYFYIQVLVHTPPLVTFSDRSRYDHNRKFIILSVRSHRFYTLVQVDRTRPSRFSRMNETLRETKREVTGMWRRGWSKYRLSSSREHK